MGTSLTGLTPATTYDALIKVGDNGPIDGTLKALSDGLGNNLPMEASSTAVNFTNGLQQSGVAVPTAAQVAGKQDTLVSGTNIKTINSTSLLGSGNIAISASPSGVAGAIQFSNGSAFASDAANLFWDDTNNRLGIGTNAPDTTAHFKGGVAGSVGVRVATFESNLPEILFKDTSNNTGFAIAKYGQIVYFVNTNASGGYSSYSGLTNSSGQWSFGGGFNPSATVHIKGSGSTSATTSLLVQNSGGTALLTVKDNQSIIVGGLTSGGGDNVLNQTVPRLYVQGAGQYLAYIGSTSDGGTGDTSLALFGLGTGGGYFGGIRMFTSNNSSSPILAMVVDRNQSVGIGLTDSTNLTVNASAKLQVDSTTKGFLPPRMTTTQRNAIASPAAGLQVFDSTMNAMCEYNGTAWRVLSAGAQSVAASTATTTVNMSSGNVQNITLTASTTLTLSSATVGTYIMKLIQGGSGSYTVTWPGTVIWSGGTAPTLTTTVGKVDIITLVFDGTNYYGNYSLNY